jgi:large subunit ribosomal protein L1
MAKDKDKKDEKEKKVKSSGKGERFVDMSADAVVVDENVLEEQLNEEKEEKEPKVRGKKYQEARKKVDTTKAYSPKEAFELLKEVSVSKKNGTVEAHFNVTEKGLSGDTNLPHSTGKARKVAIFSDELAEQIKAGKIDFDVLLATAADMPKILPLAKALGPKGLMPNPKSGTLVPDPKKALENFSGNSLHYKTEKDFPLIHTVIGKVDQPVEELTENLKALVKAVNPKNIKKVTVKSTMSPGIRVNF